MMIMEAVYIKVQMEELKAQKDAEKEAKRKQFRNTNDPENMKDLNKFR